MTDLTRRHLIAGTGAAAAVAAGVAATATAGVSLTPSLKGKSFLITGTSSGFGNLGALHYARLGAKVFATMRNLPRAEADALAAVAAEEKLDLRVLEIDVLSDAQVSAGVAEAEKINGGPLDVLVNNAGIVIGGPVELHDMEAMKLEFDTNVFGYQRMARAVLPGMRARKSGLIFNVSSQVGRVIMPGMGLYSSTKFAVESMSEQLAYELAPHGIEVVIIQPGGYPTEVGENRARYTGALAERAAPEHAAGYPQMVEGMKAVPRGGTWPGAPDPLDIPRAIAEIAAMAPGTRPLRRPVHPGRKPQLEINRVSRETQLQMLGDSAYGEYVKDVLGE
jgi:NAD(P)-dependent dehydrogenase (short-subunit alcohol dehydrogenase family)